MHPAEDLLQRIAKIAGVDIDHRTWNPAQVHEVTAAAMRLALTTAYANGAVAAAEAGGRRATQRAVLRGLVNVAVAAMRQFAAESDNALSLAALPARLRNLADRLEYHLNVEAH